MNQHDEELVARARGGDQEALRVLVEKRLPALRARVRRRLPHLIRRKVAESDVIQEAWFAAYQKLTDFEDRGDGSFTRWLDKILEHRILDALRHYGAAKREAGSEKTRGARPSTMHAAGREASPSQHAVARELEECVAAAMRELPAEYREVLRLVREEGLTLAEVGRRQGRTENAAAKLYGRAVNRLTELVFGEEGSPS